MIGNLSIVNQLNKLNLTNDELFGIHKEKLERQLQMNNIEQKMLEKKREKINKIKE